MFAGNYANTILRMDGDYFLVATNDEGLHLIDLSNGKYKLNML